MVNFLFDEKFVFEKGVVRDAGKTNALGWRLGVVL
jgi:hypothetical protein